MRIIEEISVLRDELNADDIPELKELFGIDKMPLTQSYISVKLTDISTAVVNALRRVLICEVQGYMLTTPPEGFNKSLTTDVFMLPQFVNNRISSIRLKPLISPEIINNLKMKIDVSNDTSSVMYIYSGDMQIVEGTLTEPIFNPTIKLAFLQPGKRLVVDDIHISSGFGRDFGLYNVACCGSYTHLDLEQYTEEEQKKGMAIDVSGYKQSCMISNPRRHLLKFILPATSPNLLEIKTVLIEACLNIKERLRMILSAINSTSNSIKYTIISLENDLTEGILYIPGETYTIGELIKRFVYESAPEIASITYHIVSHENKLVLSIKHVSDVTAILVDAINSAIAVMESIQKNIVDINIILQHKML